MKLLRETNWNEVFEGWKEREGSNQNWIDCATKIKGWDSWESWRGFTASQFNADKRKWGIYAVPDPMHEIPKMLIGPFTGWQSRVKNKNKTTFEELLEIPEQFDFFNTNTTILSILEGLPFPTELIGFVRKDIGKIVCIEGHHRSTAIALAKKQNKNFDFSNISFTVALADLMPEECFLLDKALERGSEKIH